MYTITIKYFTNQRWFTTKYAIIHTRLFSDIWSVECSTFRLKKTFCLHKNDNTQENRPTVIQEPVVTNGFLCVTSEVYGICDHVSTRGGSSYPTVYLTPPSPTYNLHCPSITPLHNLSYSFAVLWCVVALQQQQQQRPFNGLWSRTNKHGRHQHSAVNTIPHNQRLQIIAKKEWKRGQNVGRTSIPSHSSVATVDFRHRLSAKTAAPYDNARRCRKRNMLRCSR